MLFLYKEYLILSIFLIFPILSRGTTPVQLESEGLAIVHVKGSLTGTGSLVAIENKLYVLTPSHVIQNTVNPKVITKVQSLPLMITDDNNLHHFKEESIPSIEMSSEVLFNDPLNDIAILKIDKKMLNNYDELSEKLLYIAKLNLHFCKSGMNCFRPHDFAANLEKLENSSRVLWIYNNNIFSQFIKIGLDFPKNLLIKNEDVYISGSYDKILKIPIYGGPGMSGGVIYRDLVFGGMIVKVHYDGFPMAYAIPTDQIYLIIKPFIDSITQDENKNPYVVNSSSNSFWMSVINKEYGSSVKNFLYTSFKDELLSELVSKTNYAPGGDGGVPGSGGDGGVPGSGGDGGVPGSGGDGGVPGSSGGNNFRKCSASTGECIDKPPTEEKELNLKNCLERQFKNTFFSLQGLETIEREVPLTNPFLISGGEFYVNNEQVCRVTLSDDRIMQTNLAHYRYYKNLNKIKKVHTYCDSPIESEFPNTITSYLQGFKVFKLIKSAETCNSTPTFLFNKHLTVNGFKISITDDGMRIVILRESNGEEITIKLNAKKSGMNFRAYENDHNQRARLFFYNELSNEKLKPFSLYIQLEKELIIKQWNYND